MRKPLLRVIFLVVIILGVALFFAARYADRIVEPYVQSLLQQNKPLNHLIEYSQIRLNLVNRSIIIKDVRMYPDSSVNKDENLWLEVSVDKIRLTDFKIMELLLHKKLSIGDFIILKPDAAVHLPGRKQIKDDEVVLKDSIVKQKAPLLESISLDRMLLEKGIFKLFHNGVMVASSNDINVIAENIHLVKNNNNDPVGYSYGDLKVNLSDIILHFETGLYNISLDNFSFTKQDSSIVLKGFRMEPKYSKNEHSDKLDFQNDRFDVKIGTVSVKGQVLKSLLDGQPLEISKLLIDDLYADIYRDKNVAVDSNHFPNFYNESFLKINIPVRLDTVMITNSVIKYGELVAGKEKAGEIVLEKFNLSTYTITNTFTDSTIVPEMRIFINAHVMGEGNLNAEVVLPLTGDLHHIECRGSVGAMQLSPLNDMLEPSMNMTFKGGDLTRMTFAFSANDNISSGWMEFLYQDIDIELLKKDPDKQWGFISFMANAVALSNNPIPGKDLKTVEISFERNKNKGLINYIWKTIQSGMVRTILPTNKYKLNKRSAEKKKSEATAPKEKDGTKQKEKKKKKK